MDYLKKALVSLIKFKTITGNLEETKKAFDWIKKEITSSPLFVRDFVFNNYGSLLITTKKTKNPNLLLSAHIDVVPAQASLFNPKIIKNRLYGRGAFDMKFAIACYLKIIRDLNKDIRNKKLNFGILITSDEEKGGFYGTKRILEKGFLPKVCFLPDGGNNWQIEKEAKGVLHLKITSKGKPSHGARPWMGQNAIELIFDFWEALREIFPSEPCRVKDHFHDTINIGRIEGGDVINKVPHKAFAWVDIRFTSGRKKREILRKVSDLSQSFKNVKVEKLYVGNYHKVKTACQYIRSFSEIANKYFSIKTDFVSSHGTSDARYFSERGIPVVVTRPKGGGLHSDREWIDIADLEKFYFVLREFVKKHSS